MALSIAEAVWSHLQDEPSTSEAENGEGDVGDLDDDALMTFGDSDSGLS